MARPGCRARTFTRETWVTKGGRPEHGIWKVCAMRGSRDVSTPWRGLAGPVRRSSFAQLPAPAGTLWNSARRHHPSDTRRRSRPTGRASHARHACTLHKPRAQTFAPDSPGESCPPRVHSTRVPRVNVRARQPGRAEHCEPINFADPVSPPLSSSASVHKGPEGLRAFGSGQAAEAGPPKASKHG